MMNTHKRQLAATLLCSLVPTAYAFDSGSTGDDGVFNPTVSTVLDLPEDGIYNFTDVTIPTGVTVTFNRNTTNTPVVMLATGDITIDGTLSVNGANGADVGTAGDSGLGDDGLPGQGGPGGYSGGRGASSESRSATGSGLGPGGSRGGVISGGVTYGGAGGSFATRGGYKTTTYIVAGPTYGSSHLLPLIGGSGGGGGAAGVSIGGSGGGGGGGAILIAASGSVSLSGQITANGGRPGKVDGNDCGATGGGGSGGAIRILASHITGDGLMSADGGLGHDSPCVHNNYERYTGGAGRIRLEADTFSFSSATAPAASIDVPGELFVAGLPTLRIATVAGVDAPASPSGIADIRLPADTPNPVSVTFEASGIPVGNTVELTLTPATGGYTRIISNALDGTTDRSTASTSINLPSGASSLSASVTYTITLAMAERLQSLAEGEEIASIKVLNQQGQALQYFLVTENGQDIPVAAAALASAGS